MSTVVIASKKVHRLETPIGEKPPMSLIDENHIHFDESGLVRTPILEGSFNIFHAPIYSFLARHMDIDDDELLEDLGLKRKVLEFRLMSGATMNKLKEAEQLNGSIFRLDPITNDS